MESSDRCFTRVVFDYLDVYGSSSHTNKYPDIAFYRPSLTKKKLLFKLLAELLSQLLAKLLTQMLLNHLSSVVFSDTISCVIG